ncbi:UvrD-helicase domain-containing protein, partial [Lactococcus garvieae]|uniref:UvrD-helicase domain-containing protein n=1 Tax=Lactococcus garvieae TaxID=1363 RepID=UPI0032B33B36
MSGKRNGKNKMNNNFPRILEGLSESQKNIITDTTNNLYVTACPGSGKTRTLTP